MTRALLQVWDTLIHALSLAFAVVREIFDESAYARFLARQQTRSSRQAYSAFLDEQAQAQTRRHRCC